MLTMMMDEGVDEEEDGKVDEHKAKEGYVDE